MDMILQLPPEINKLIFSYYSTPTADIVRQAIKENKYKTDDYMPFYKHILEGYTYYCRCGEFRYAKCCGYFDISPKSNNTDFLYLSDEDLHSLDVSFYGN